MRGMLLTVWAETSADTTAIYTQITNGVNGIVCEDYAAVAEAISSFNDVTTLVSPRIHHRPPRPAQRVR